MSDHIQYNFAANNSSLDDINGHISGIQEVRSDIDNVFQILGTVYEGEGATALNQAHQKFSAMLDDALNNASNTQKFAQDQQDAMQALDRANAAAF
jgi:flagellar hook-basal body complex protein FliE